MLVESHLHPFLHIKIKMYAWPYPIQTLLELAVLGRPRPSPFPSLLKDPSWLIGFIDRLLSWLTKVEIYIVFFASVGPFTTLSTKVMDLMKAQGIETSLEGNNKIIRPNPTWARPSWLHPCCHMVSPTSLILESLLVAFIYV